MDDIKFDQLLKNNFLSKNNFSLNIKKNGNVEIKSNDGNDKYKIGTIVFGTFATYNVAEIKEEQKDNEVLKKIIEELKPELEEGQNGGKRKSRRNRKSKKGKRSRKARKSRRKSNRRRGRR